MPILQMRTLKRGPCELRLCFLLQAGPWNTPASLRNLLRSCAGTGVDEKPLSARAAASQVGMALQSLQKLLTSFHSDTVLGVGVKQ